MISSYRYAAFIPHPAIFRGNSSQGSEDRADGASKKSRARSPASDNADTTKRSRKNRSSKSSRDKEDARSRHGGKEDKGKEPRKSRGRSRSRDKKRKSSRESSGSRRSIGKESRGRRKSSERKHNSKDGKDHSRRHSSRESSESRHHTRKSSKRDAPHRRQRSSSPSLPRSRSRDRDRDKCKSSSKSHRRSSENKHRSRKEPHKKQLTDECQVDKDREGSKAGEGSPQDDESHPLETHGAEAQEEMQTAAGQHDSKHPERSEGAGNAAFPGSPDSAAQPQTASPDRQQDADAMTVDGKKQDVPCEAAATIIDVCRPEAAGLASAAPLPQQPDGCATLEGPPTYKSEQASISQQDSALPSLPNGHPPASMSQEGGDDEAQPVDNVQPTAAGEEAQTESAAFAEPCPTTAAEPSPVAPSRPASLLDAALQAAASINQAAGFKPVAVNVQAAQAAAAALNRAAGVGSLTGAPERAREGRRSRWESSPPQAQLGGAGEVGPAAGQQTALLLSEDVTKLSAEEIAMQLDQIRRAEQLQASIMQVWEWELLAY